MRLLYFGRLAEVAGTRGGEVELPAGVTTVADVRAWLAREQPLLREALRDPGVFAVANDELVRGDASIEGVAELAFMPPVSGG